MFNYSYQMSVHFKRGGRRFSKLYEAVLPSRFNENRVYVHPLVLVSDSDHVITAEDIQRSREAIAKAIEKAENTTDADGTGPDAGKDGGYWTIRFSSDGRNVALNIVELIRNVQLSNMQQTRGETGDLIAVDFVPKSELTFDRSVSYLSKMEGRIWIDAATSRVIRIEGFAPSTFAAAKDLPDADRLKEAVFLFEQVKVAEGFWFPKTVRFNFARHPEIFDPFELEFGFSNYKKASVDVQYQEQTTRTGTNPQ